MLRMTGNRDDAMELFQEMCLRAYRAYPRLMDIAQIRPWLYRIAVNLCRNRARDNARRARVIVDSSANHREPAVDDASAGQDLGAVRALIAAHGDAGATLATMELSDPSGYGRVLRGADGSFERVVETKVAGDATPEELAIREVNAGLYLFDGGALLGALGPVSTLLLARAGMDEGVTGVQGGGAVLVLGGGGVLTPPRR